MERAKDLLQRLLADGHAYIDELIETRVAEELFLDFKRSSNNGDSRNLSDVDRNNLAKAISGFSNAVGGVVVWGVDCSPDHIGADVARAKVPISNLSRFISNLQGAVSGCTIPPHGGVENYAISNENTDEGFVVTYIPASDNAPHQVVGRQQYYMRAGSAFVPVPHQVLAGMFGRRPQPNVYHMFAVSPATHDQRTLICNYGIFATNGGPGIASDLFFTAMIIEGLGDNTRIAWEFPDQDNWSGNFAFGRQIGLITKVGVRVPPKAFLMPTSLRIEMEPPFTAPLRISVNIGCSGSPTTSFDIATSIETANRVYAEYFEKSAAGNIEEKDRHEIPTNLLNLETNQ
jgi:hypothetical protein